MSAGTQQVPIPWTPAAPQLVMAYSVCKGITRTAAKNFYYAFLVLPLRKRDEPQQRIRHAAARRQHHPQASSWGRFDNGRDLAEAVGVGDARPPELVHDPGSGVEHTPVRLY